MEYLKEILIFIAGLGTGLSLKFVVRFFASSNSGRSSVSQSNNRVGGSMAGRDINTGKRDE